MSETATIVRNNDLSVELDDQLDFVRSEYSNRFANSINYIIPALRAINSSPGSERETFLEMAISESLIDIYTQIIEHPLSETSAKYEYDLVWDQMGTKWKLMMGSRALDDTYNEAMNSANGQIPEFEIRRNKANYANYETLRTARKNGERRTFVEFSPSPELTEEAKNRGYFGNDTIFFFLYENGIEKVVQKWLPAGSREEYTALLSSLGIKLDPSADDLSIIASSGFFGEEDLEKISQFVNERTQKLEDMKSQIIEAHAKSFIWDNVKVEFRQMLYDAANRLAKGVNISEELSMISETMAVLQFGFRKFIHDVMKGEAGLNYTASGNFSEFQSMDRCMQIKMMTDAGYTMTACGVSEQFGSFGKASSITNPSSDIQPTPNRPDPVKCDVCGRTIKYVKNGDPSTYDQNLKCCGKSYGC